MKRQLLVLDKSYVRGAATAEIRDACDRFTAVMPEDLFFELISDDLETRTRCFRKFPSRENPVELVPNVGSLLRFEKESHSPSSPLRDRCVDMAFKFNAGLASGEFRLNERQLRTVELWKEDLAQSVDLFEERAINADRLFPDLRGVLPGQNKDKVTKLVERIATDVKGLKEAYTALAPPGFPPSSIVGRTWAVLRWLQVHFIGAAEYFAAYGSGVNRTNRAKLENEVVDLNYLIVGVLAGGLATRDKAIARRFRLLCPKGALIE